LKKRWIEWGSSPYGSSILFVNKKDGALQIVVDCCAINKQTRKNCPLLSWIDDLFDYFANASIFSSLDLAKGYNHICLYEEVASIMTFRTLKFGGIVNLKY